MEGWRTHLLDEVHEAAAKTPGLVSVALQGVHGHLRRPLVAHRHDVDCIVEQSCIGLQRTQACLKAAAAASQLPAHLPLSHYKLKVSWVGNRPQRRALPYFLKRSQLQWPY